MEQDFEEDDFKKEKVNLKTWKKIIATVMKKKRNCILLFLSVFFVAFLDILYPLMDRYAIDHFFQADSDYSNAVVFLILYGVVAIGYFFGIAGFLYFAGSIEVDTSYELRKEAYDNLQRLPFSYFDKTPQGWIMARMTSDSRKLSSIISWGLVDGVWAIFSMIGILIVLFVVEWRLALIVMAVMPFLFIFSMIIRKKILVAYRDARKVNSLITGAYNESFMGSKTTKSLVIESSNEDEFLCKAKALRRASLVAVLFSSMFGPVVYLLGYIGVSATLLGGAKFLLDGALTIGTLAMFINYTVRFFDPVINLSRIISDFQNAQASAERLVQLIETVPEIQDSDDVIKKYGTLFDQKRENWETIKGDIEFNHVTFKYNAGETVLKDFNLKIKAGSNVALVGHTGAGKSTIVNLICRFYEPTEGQILIDGKDYKERSISWLHANLGYVLQTPQLFSGTIMDNIRYGKLDATDDEVIAAAKIANVDSFVSKLDGGYNAKVGEAGSRLSLGEKQLVSFARAILANPKILILDEATSSIDTETERLIQDAIGKLLDGRTSFVIAHRLSTVVGSDLILVMKDGCVIESGTHRELLEQKGYYFNLYKTQFMKEKIEEM